MPIYFTEREVVIPGQLLSDNGKHGGEGTYVVNGKVYASQVGIAVRKDDKVSVIAFKGVYKPQPGDKVIGIITDVKPNGYEVMLGRHLTGSLRMPDRRSVKSFDLKVGDVIYVKIRESGLRGITLDHTDRIKKIDEGILVSIHPAKVSRLIGRRGSMINMIKRLTGCEIIMGRNGLIIVKGPDPRSEFAAISAIKMVELEAHTQGLTERVENKVKKIIGGVD